MNEPRLSDYADFARRHRLALIAILAAGLLLGLLMVAAERKSYTADVAVLTPAVPMSAAPDGTAQPPEEVTMDTEAQLLHSAQVLRRLQDGAQDIGDPSTLRERISISVPRHTRVLIIHFRAPTPQAAKAGATILAESYLRYRHQILVGRQESHLEAIRDRIAALRGQLDSLPGTGDDEASIAEGTTSARRGRLLDQIEDLRSRLGAIEGPAAEPGQVVRAAEVPTRPDETNNEVTVASSVGVSLLVGLGVGMIRDRLPRRVHSKIDVTRTAGLPVLGEIALGSSLGPLALRRTRSAYRRLYNVLTSEHIGSLLIAANTAKLAETVASGLATTSAQAGRRTILLLSGPPHSGAVDSAVPESVEVATALPHDLQDERLVSRIVDRTTGTGAQLVIAGPPADRADTLPLGARTDAVVLVAERGHTLDRDLAVGRRYLELAGATVRGVVLARARATGPAALFGRTSDA